MKTIIKYELRKIFTRRLSLAAIAAVLCLSLLFTVSTWRNSYAFDGKSREGSGQEAVEIDRSIAETWQGVLTDEKVQQMMSAFSPKTDLHGLSAKYLYYNATQSSLFKFFSDQDGNWNGLSVSDVFGEEEIIIGYVDGWLKTSRNMVPTFLLLSLVILLMTAPVYAGEYGGMDNLLLTSRYGITKCTLAKGIAVFLAAFLMTALLTALALLPASVIYGTYGLECSILFCSSDFGDGYLSLPVNITCATLIKYQILLAFTGSFASVGIALLLSAASGSQIAALAGAAGLYFFPALLPVTETNPLFKYLGLLPFYHAQFTSLMSIEQIEGNFLYSIYAVPAALLIAAIGFMASRTLFSRHEIR